jgi:acyl-homoserine lactone acylase PvdQ
LPEASPLVDDPASFRDLLFGHGSIEAQGWRRLLVQLPGGQSANPDSQHYDDLLPLYLDNQPIDLIFDINEAATQALDKFEY